MAYSYLLLGPVLFQNFELPGSICWGGGQSLTVHKLPGGTRVIDAMGRDDTEISWTGVFTGNDCGLRARTIDLMRADGAVWPLTWDSYFYSVIISRFEADFRRPNWIPYRIACTVLRDEAEVVVEIPIALAGNILTDITAADGMGTGLDLSPASLAVSAAGATTLGTSSYSQAQSQLNISTSATNNQLSATGAQLTSATTVDAATILAGQAAQLATARGYLQRAGTNLSTASS